MGCLRLQILVLFLSYFLVRGVTERSSISYAGQHSPPQVVSFGQNITLRCQHFPEANGDVSFYWRTMAQDILSSLPDVSGSGKLQTSKSSPSLSLRINEDFPPLLRVFCHIVSATNNSTIAVKMVQLRVKGIMSHATRSGLHFREVKLRAEREPYLGSRRLIQQVCPLMEWNYDRTSGADSKITTSTEPGSSNLTISQPNAQISGAYRAEANSLFKEDDDDCEINDVEILCSALVLPLLKHSALTSPVEYRVSVEENSANINVQAKAREEPAHFVSYFLPSTFWTEEFEVKLVRHRFTSSSADLVFHVFLNGVKANSRPEGYHGRDTMHSYNLIESKDARVTLAIGNITRDDAGFYEIVFTVPTSQIDLSCCSQYSDLIFDDSEGMELQNYIMGLATMELKLVDYPLLRVYGDRTNHTKEDRVTLTCGIQSLNGPNLTHFEWKKNDEIFYSSAENNTTFSLETSEAFIPFGEFECMASNGFLGTVERILISETVLVEYVLRPSDTASKCKNSEEGILQFMGSLYTGILSALCSCELTSSNFYSQSFSCDEADGTILYTATFTYSNADGSLTASALVEQSDQWITGLREINGATYDIMNPSSSSLEKTSVVTYRFTAAIFTVIVSTCIAVGIVVGVILTCFLTRAATLIRLKRFKLRKPQAVSISTMAGNVVVLKSLRANKSVALPHPLRPSVPVLPLQSKQPPQLPSLQLSLAKQHKDNNIKSESSPHSNSQNDSSCGMNLPTVLAQSEDCEEVAISMTKNTAYRKMSSDGLGCSISDLKQSDDKECRNRNETVSSYDYPRLPNGLSSEFSDGSDETCLYMN